MTSTTGPEITETVTTGGPEHRPGASRQTAVSAMRLAKRFLITREGSIIVVTVLLGVYFSLTVSSFLTTSNFQGLLPYFAPFAILAAGEVFLMINGEIDLSIGGAYLFTPFLYLKLVNGVGLPWAAAAVLAVLACGGLGLVNGFFCAILGVNSFITTLGTNFTMIGLTLIWSHAVQVAMPGAQVTTNTVTGVNSTSMFANIFGAGTYSELIWALVIVVLLQVILMRTRWGRHTVAVGSNRIAAAEAGVRVRANLMRNFVVCSSCAALVGILEDVRTSSFTPDPSGANSILLTSIAAAVIGGTLLAGGSGTVAGAAIGALFLGILQDGLALRGVNANYLYFWLGLAILLAMVINVYVGRVRRRSGIG
jgi:simple sugar transport system permease protein